ncbi:MAG: hypothetical protein QOE90_2167 [Thermoplasmata archaeon]|nr:hypothetical protein [Thermoplasmata archaeon]
MEPIDNNPPGLGGAPLRRHVKTMSKTLRWTALLLTLATLAAPLATALPSPSILYDLGVGPYVNYCNNELSGDDVWVLLVGADTNGDNNGYAACVMDESAIVHDNLHPFGGIGALVDGDLCTRTTCAGVLGTTGAFVLIGNTGTHVCAAGLCPELTVVVVVDGVGVSIVEP